MIEQLKTIYLRTLHACAPALLLRKAIEQLPSLPRSVVAIGKCAGALRDALDHDVEAFVAIPAGYRMPVKPAIIAVGGHPQMTRASFDAGRQLLEFIHGRDDILFLISGGGSACVEQPLAPWFTEHDLIEANARLLAAGPPIGGMNCVRKHLSAIKGGRLASRVNRSVTMVFSDVATGALSDVASGPSLPDITTKRDAIAVLEKAGGCGDIIAILRDDACPETIKEIPGAPSPILIADNTTLVSAAASIAASLGLIPLVVEQQIESDVSDAAQELLHMATDLRKGEILIAGGEPTVMTRGDGKGGRCLELAVRMALSPQSAGLHLLAAASDGLDGNSAVAGVVLTLPTTLDASVAARELSRSNSLAVAEAIGETLMMAPDGNNLRDLYLLARS